MRKVFAPILALLLLAGCARYDFQIVQPAELSQRISATPARIETNPLTYQMQAHEGRLVVQVFNPTEDTVQLLGERSYVIDPRGGSHPVRSQTIGPNSFAKLVLPPLQPYLEQRSPRWNFGVGTRISRTGAFGHYPAYSYYHPYYYDPYFAPYHTAYYGHDPYYTRTIAYNDPNDQFYWDWRGESSIRLSLTYQRQDNTTFRDEFVIRRVKR